MWFDLLSIWTTYLQVQVRTETNINFLLTLSYKINRKGFKNLQTHLWRENTLILQEILQITFIARYLDPPYPRVNAVPHVFIFIFRTAISFHHFEIRSCFGCAARDVIRGSDHRSLMIGYCENTRENHSRIWRLQVMDYKSSLENLLKDQSVFSSWMS